MAADDGLIDFMFLDPLYQSTGSSTGLIWTFFKKNAVIIQDKVLFRTFKVKYGRVLGLGVGSVNHL